MTINIIYLIIVNGIFNLLTLPITIIINWIFSLRENNTSFWAIILIAILLYSLIIYLFFSPFMAFYKKRLVTINEQIRFSKIAFIALTIISLTFISTPVGIIANSFYLYGYFSVEHLLNISVSFNIAYFLIPILLTIENMIKCLCIQNKIFNYTNVSTNEAKEEALIDIKSKKRFKKTITEIVVALLIFLGLTFSYTVVLPYGYLFSQYGFSACECQLKTVEPVHFRLSGNVFKIAQMVDSRWEFTRNGRVFNVQYTSGETSHFKHFIDDYQLEDIDIAVSNYLRNNFDERIIHILIDTRDIDTARKLVKKELDNEFVVNYLNTIGNIVIYAEFNNYENIDTQITELEKKIKNMYSLSNVIVIDCNDYEIEFTRFAYPHNNYYLTSLGYNHFNL